MKLASYTPSSQLHDITTLEVKERTNRLIENNPKTSSVRYKPIVYNKQPEVWQKVGCVWDKVQERSGFCKENRLVINISDPKTQPAILPRSLNEYRSFLGTCADQSITLSV